MIFSIFRECLPSSAEPFWTPFHRHAQKCFHSDSNPSQVDSEVSSRYLLLFTLDRAMAHERQSEHHAGVLAECTQGFWQRAYRGASRGHTGVLAERPQSELHFTHHDLFQKEGPSFSLFRGASPKLCLPRRIAFSVLKKDLYGYCGQGPPPESPCNNPLGLLQQTITNSISLFSTLLESRSPTSKC